MQISEETRKKIIKMEECRGHKIRVKLIDGKTVEGKCMYFTSPFDNEPEIADISIKRENYSGLICITEPEIESITLFD